MRNEDNIRKSGNEFVTDCGSVLRGGHDLVVEWGEEQQAVGVDEAGIRRLFRDFSRGTIQRWVRITDAAMHEKPKGFPGFKVSPAAFLIDGVQNNRTPPDWLYAHEKKQERAKWERDRTPFDQSEQTLRDQYEHAKTRAFAEFRQSPEGQSIYDKTFPILLSLYKHTEPHRADEMAKQATLFRMKKHDFQFPPFATWIRTQARSDSQTES